ncbi:MAG: hypothetical protein WCA44_05865 [Acidobacteriaceae bacterium]
MTTDPHDARVPEDLKAMFQVAIGQRNTWPREYVVGLIERIAIAEQRARVAEAANELDRRSLWEVIRAIDAEITGRMWLIEGRGSYEWDDDRYRQEFGWAVNALQEKLEPLRKIAHDLNNCPSTEKGVDAVRKLEASIADAEKRAADAEAQVKALSPPISREEIERSYRGGGWIGFANRFNAILAARLSSAKGGDDGKPKQ